MPTIGEQLRAAREAKGLAIEDAHRHTKIHTKILRAIEEDRAAEVIDPAYARGFLKKYAAFLQLDPDPLVTEFLRQGQGSASGPGSSVTQTSASSKLAVSSGTQAVGSPHWATPVLVAVVAVIGVTFLAFLARDLYRTASATGSASVAAPAMPVPPPAPKPLIPRSQPLKLSIKAAQNCWMQVKADDKVLFQSVLGKGREETWTAGDTIELWVGNAAALTLTLNGRPLQPLGAGVIRGVRITRYGVTLPKTRR